MTTNRIAGHHGAPIPTAIYGAVLLIAAFSCTNLQAKLIRLQGADSAIGPNRKG